MRGIDFGTMRQSRLHAVDLSLDLLAHAGEAAEADEGQRRQRAAVDEALSEADAIRRDRLRDVILCHT